MPRFRSTFPRLPIKTKALIFVCACLFAGAANSSEALGQTPAPGDVVFSQIYSQGGTPGSAYQDNFLELFNRSNNPVDIGGMPFHITSDTGQFIVAVSFVSSQGLIIQPGGYLLIQFQTDRNGGAPLPFADLFVPVFSQFSFGLSPSGKIALTTPGTFLSGCALPNPGVMDFVGYGSTANCFEGTGPTATLTATTAAIRKSSGCTDTNNNSSDFFVSAPNPRNRFWPRHPCSANAIDEADFFVRQHYADFLNRQPDPSGLAFWSKQIASCITGQACIDVKRINVSGAFFLSIEFQETGYLVYRTYKAAYGNLPNAPVPLKFDEFLPDTLQLGQNVVVNAPGWELQLANNKDAFFMDFVSRSRFVNDYLTTMSPAQFVGALFSKAGVIPSAAERTAAINEFGAATDTNNTSARARALRRVAENSKLDQQEKNKAFVLMQYFGYLRRNPNDPPETTLDFSGYNFWLNKLNQFNGNFVDAEMVKAFITSAEYRQRF
ncbi:MAG TPA: DUF4214 domain-containing protein [Pyrinomonadaceae bacterium]|jgi:hypothetical protein|nr:DUF4214 domain-containing protein [Pyrinomonadaceae bacterium]